MMTEPKIQTAKTRRTPRGEKKALDHSAVRRRRGSHSTSAPPRLCGKKLIGGLGALAVHSFFGFGIGALAVPVGDATRFPETSTAGLSPSEKMRQVPIPFALWVGC